MNEEVHCIKGNTQDNINDGALQITMMESILHFFIYAENGILLLV